jgi:pimeloyl-ACP methyl ester carboxylesterase
MLCAAALAAAGQGFVGTWQGSLQAGGVKLRMGLHVAKDEKGEYSSKLDSIDQSVMGIPVKTTTIEGNRIKLAIPAIAGTYDGTLSADSSEITGTLTQGGAALPLAMKRVEKIEGAKRPQNPKPPFPYQAVDVGYPSGSVKLAGTLTIPAGAGPFPAAIMITGSGPQDRDEALMQHKPFWVIADHLSRRGVAVLRLDDRGVGGSTGNSTRATLEDFANDVLAGVAFLKERKEIDGKHIGVIGHSEGGVVGPFAAAKSSDIGFVVMLGGTGVDGQNVLYAQAAAIARASGAPEPAIAQNRELQKMFFDVFRAEADEKAAAATLWANWVKIKAGMPEAQRKIADSTDGTMRSQIAQFNSPEMRSFLFHDPAAVLRKLKMPVLALNGSRDVQVLPEQNLPAIVQALAAGGNGDFTVTELPGLNHLFQHCRLCTPNEYGEIEETFAPEALEIVSEWILRHTRR